MVNYDWMVNEMWFNYPIIIINWNNNNSYPILIANRLYNSRNVLDG